MSDLALARMWWCGSSRRRENAHSSVVDEVCDAPWTNTCQDHI